MSATARNASGPRRYADASALVKLVIREPESEELIGYLGKRAPKLLTSRLALVEVTRAARLARPEPDVDQELDRVLRACDLLAVTAGILREAAALASERLRTLDAVHLASIVHSQPDEVLAYDRQLILGARDLGFIVVHPGAVG